MLPSGAPNSPLSSRPSPGLITRPQQQRCRQHEPANSSRSPVQSLMGVSCIGVAVRPERALLAVFSCAPTTTRLHKSTASKAASLFSMIDGRGLFLLLYRRRKTNAGRGEGTCLVARRLILLGGLIDVLEHKERGARETVSMSTRWNSRREDQLFLCQRVTVSPFQ